jgi:acyl carrier protein
MSTNFDTLLETAFRTGLDLRLEEDVTILIFDEHPHWDSLGHISLIDALEREFGVEFDDGEVMTINSYSAAVTLLRSRGALAP